MPNAPAMKPGANDVVIGSELSEHHHERTGPELKPRPKTEEAEQKGEHPLLKIKVTMNPEPPGEEDGHVEGSEEDHFLLPILRLASRAARSL